MERALVGIEKMIIMKAAKQGICEKLKAMMRKLEVYETMGIDLSEQKAYIVNLAVQFGCGEVDKK